jgi:hypothetical protein
VRPIAPKFRMDVEWIREVPIAEDQHEYRSLTCAIVTYDDGSRQVYARWTFTPEERARIAAGEDIYLSFPNQMAPHRVELRPDWVDETVDA